MDLHHPLKLDISQHNLNGICVKDCDPALNHDFKCIGFCFKICPLLCKTLSLQQDFLPPIPRIPPIPPIPPFVDPHPSPPVTETGGDISQTNKIATTSMIIISSLVVASILICIFCCFLRFHYYLRERRERTRPVFFGTQEDFLDEDRGTATDHHVWYINTIGLQQPAIDLIAVFTYKKDELVIEGTECSVCLSEFEENESLKLLPKCSHAFHIPCIDTWLRSHKNCPLCRAPIVSDDFDAQRDLGANSDISSDGVMSLQIREEETSESRNEDDPDCPFAEESQTLRRSVSLDSSSAMAISNAFDSESMRPDHSKSKNVCRRPRNGSLSFRKLMKSSSIGYMLHKGSIPLKRSFSNNAKSSSSSSSGHRKSHDSSSLVLPL